MSQQEQTQKKGKRSVTVGIIAAVVALGLVAGVVAFVNHLRNSMLDGDGMVYYSAEFLDFSQLHIYEGGDMIGSEYDLEVVRISTEECQITLTTRESHDARQDVKKAIAGRSFIADANAIMEAACMPDWGEFPDSDIFILDGGTTHVSYMYNGQRHDFTSNKELPDGAWSAVRQLRELAESYLKM